jgi:transposase-like protein
LIDNSAPGVEILTYLAYEADKEEKLLENPVFMKTPIVRNGKKGNGVVQNYRCKVCKRQFISDHERKYAGTLSWVNNTVKMLLIRGLGIGDVSVILGISIKKVLNVLVSTKYRIKPRRSHYDVLEIDELWTYVGSKKNKQWLIYAYHRENGEIVAYVWGKRDIVFSI